MPKSKPDRPGLLYPGFEPVWPPNAPRRGASRATSRAQAVLAVGLLVANLLVLSTLVWKALT